MPRYTFKCEKCNEYSELVCTISEYDEKSAKWKCPCCHSKRVHRDYSVDSIFGSVSQEPKTLGQLAERNTKKYGKSKVEAIRAEHKTKRIEGMKELPQGMSRVNKYSDIKDNYTKEDWKKKGKIK